MRSERRSAGCILWHRNRRAQPARHPFVPCDHQYLNFRGVKFSKSRGAAVEVPYFLSKYDPDPLRFYLTATLPETNDTEACPACPERSRGEGLDDEDRTLLKTVEAGFETVGELYAACQFRAASNAASALAREAAVAKQLPSRRAASALDHKAPWLQIKEDRQAAATTVYVILRAVDNLKTIPAPILPHTAQQLHKYLGYDGQLFGTQHLVEYQEETRSHAALTYDHTGAWGRGRRVNCRRGKRCVHQNLSSRSWTRA